MWVVRLAQAITGRFRIIAEGSKEAAEQKAADQTKAWGERSAGLYVEIDLSGRLLRSKHLLRKMAAQLTVQAEEEGIALGSLLRDGTLVEHTGKWARDHSPYHQTAPVEPRRESYTPQLRFPSRLFPPTRRRERARAEERFRSAHADWEKLRMDWEVRKSDWLRGQVRRNAVVDKLEAAYNSHEADAVAVYCRLLLKASPYPYIAASVPEIAMDQPFTNSVAATEHPDTFPRTLELVYLRETRTLVVDYELPRREAIPSVKGYRYVAAGNKVIPVPTARSWVDETYDSVLYQVALRTLYELFRWDNAGALDLVVFNGWVTSIDKATGQSVRPCVLTVQVRKSEFLEINLAQVEPKTCFRKLKGISAAKLAAMSPVRPILQISREDKRFVAARPVIGGVDTSTNLAAMDWEDFEQLIRDVFEKEFSGGGGEVKITRASRDHGVDAVAFDPDPIRGGKIVIQAKRYTDTVSVSAVRDLYGTILNEGANKGILVTTADYGADAYEFPKGKPITLLSGSELLYLLQKHGRNARIDLAEARLLAAGEKRKVDSRG